MNYYYDPILGLQYDYLGSILIVDITQIPEDMNIEDFLFKWQSYSERGINFGNGEQILQITDFKL